MPHHNRSRLVHYGSVDCSAESLGVTSNRKENHKYYTPNTSNIGASHSITLLICDFAENERCCMSSSGQAKTGCQLRAAAWPQPTTACAGIACLPSEEKENLSSLRALYARCPRQSTVLITVPCDEPSQLIPSFKIGKEQSPLTRRTRANFESGRIAPESKKPTIIQPER